MAKTEKNTVGTPAVANLLGVSTAVVVGMLERGELAGTRAGRNWKITRSEFLRLERELNTRGSRVGGRA